MSRIIVKNIPKEITEVQLRDQFNKKGEITDVKIIKDEKGVSRRFAFLGYKNESDAKLSVKYYNGTYIFTCKISVEEAKIQGDPSLNSKWATPRGNKINKDVIIHKVEDKETKIKTILEIAKQMSNKTKFDNAGLNALKNETEIKIETEGTDQKLEIKDDSQIDVEGSYKAPAKKMDPKRLYLRNLAFEVNEQDVRTKFEKFGEISEIHIPTNTSNLSFGYGYISYATIESTILALSEMDKKIFQGRILHITPAQVKTEKVLSAPRNEENEKFNAQGKSAYKKHKQEDQRANYDNEINWNYLFMNQNAVVDSISKKLNIPKSEIMSRDNTNLAVQVASMETAIINETKDWLATQGINLDVLKGKRGSCTRSKNIILVKNISPNLNSEKLEEYFSRYGMLVRFILSPSNTLALAEFVDFKHAENCMKKLAYFEVEGLPLFLEYAPEGLAQKTENKSEPELKVEKKDNEIDLISGQGKILFVSNLNFTTKEFSIKKCFAEKNFKPIAVKIATHQKEDTGKEVSSGFGFIEFEDEQSALKVMKNFQGTLLDGHSLKLSIAKTGNKSNDTMLKNKRKSETELNDYDFEGDEVTNNKLLVKNLAFESNKDELRQLFKNFGEVKSLRIPSKLDGSHRGFAFVDFVSHEEAKNAFKSLQNTHFYGRKLVLEWAQKEKTVEDLRKDADRKMNAINIKTHRTQMKGNKELKDFK